MNAIMSVLFYIPAEGTSIDSGHSKTKLSAQRKCICPREKKARNKRQRQDIEDEGEGEANKEGRKVLSNVTHTHTPLR